ncbi:MAG: hypothetical protein AB7O88_00365 [Reyranellaceae bacterium]
MALIVSVSFTEGALARVDCRNGKYCPDGNICLKDGLCGEKVDVPPGSVKFPSGTWCEPGFREHQYKPGACVPIGYSDCRNGAICPPGSRCNEDQNTCDGGGPATGPQCGKYRCEEGRICSSSGRCMNTTYYQDCGGGTICSKNKACALDGGCAIVGIGRTQQISYSDTGKKDNNTR